MDKSYEELSAENEKLRSKLAPDEDKKLTGQLTLALNGKTLDGFHRSYKGVQCVVVEAADLWAMLFGTEPNMHEVRRMGLSLQASLWNRGALHGSRVYYMPIEEYNEQYLGSTPDRT